MVVHPAGRNDDDGRRAGSRCDHPAGGVGFSSHGKSNIGFYGAGFGCMAWLPVKLRGVFFVEFGLECMARQCVQ